MINPDQKPVWRPEHDLAPRYSSLQPAGQDSPQTLEATIAQVAAERIPAVADYDGRPDLQQEMVESIARPRFALQSTEDAARRLTGIAKITPLVTAHKLSEFVGAPCFIKLETEQVTGSFKLRGSFNMVAALPDWQRARGLTIASAGNAAQGVAFAARHFGVPATIFMPWNTPNFKVNAVEELGANIVLEGKTYDEAAERCQVFLEEQGSDAPLLIPAFDHPLVIAGQGSMGKEILAQDAAVECIVVPFGGGSAATGIARYVKSLRPEVRIVAVEPAGSNAMQLSRQLGRRTALPRVSTIAEGLAVRQPGRHTFELAQRCVDDIITVSEAEILLAMLDLHKNLGVRAEPSGAVAIAGLKKVRPGVRTVAVCTGGNIDPKTFNHYLAEASALAA